MAANVALRPPRVAILVPQGDRWRDWAMRALSVASEYWGGGGFILVPYDRETAEPSPVFPDIVRAYDPDHVVTLQIPAQDFEAWHPGSIRIANVADEAERRSLIESIHGSVDDPAADAARVIVAAWCSPLRSFRYGKDRPARQHETVTSVERPRRDDRFWRGLPLIPPPSESRIAASEAWRSDVGLLAAARLGVAHEERDNRPEPSAAVLDWLIEPAVGAPSELHWGQPSSRDASLTISDAWFRAGQRLMQVSRGYLEDVGGIVIGDSATDFALALAYDRILGCGIWLTPAQLADDDTFKHHIRPSMWSLVSEVEQSSRHIVVTSTSLTQRQIADAAERLREPEYEFQRFSRLRERVNEHQTVQPRFARVERGLLEMVVDEHVGVSIVLPMDLEEDGTRASLSGLDTPMPTQLLYPNDLGKMPYWYVDVALARDKAPRGRDLPSSAVLAVDEGWFPEVNLRSSKHGVSFDPRSMGFVSGGTLLPGRIGRPRLRSLSIRAWVEGMAEAEGLGVRLSMPGRHAELVRRRLGSRNRLIELIAGAALPVLRSFVPAMEAPKERHPDRIVLGLEPYLSFAAIDDLLPGDSDEAMRLIDELSVSRLLRRGLVLGCEECGRPSFLDADRIGQQYECPQCATVNALVSSRWRIGSEPRWFYDLHATFRELLSTNGHVPLLAAAHMKRGARSYADSPELEFFDLQTKQQIAEVDVIASVDDEVVLVEAKASGEFSAGTRTAQTRKLVRIAEVLRADRVVLATSHQRWKPADVDHVTRELGKVAPFAVKVDVTKALGS